MRVLFLSNELPFDQTGSAYGFRLERLRHALQEHDIQTDFASLRTLPFSRPLLAQPLNVPFLVKRAAQFDFIHAGGDAAFTAVMLRPFVAAPIVHDVHGDAFEEAKLEWKARRDPRSAYWVSQAAVTTSVAARLADYFLVVSEPSQRQLVHEKHIPVCRIGIVRNGVDVSLFRPSPAKATHSLVVGYAGGFQALQAIEDLILAFEELEGEDVRLKLVGFLPNDSELKATIARRLGDRVELVDRVSQAELVSHLAAAQILVSPRPRHRASQAGLPTKFAEYLAMGKPVIVYDTDETARLVRQHGCGLVSDPHPQALAEVIRTAARLSRAELDQMAANARLLAERELSWSHIGRQYADLLHAWHTSPRVRAKARPKTDM